MRRLTGIAVLTIAACAPLLAHNPGATPTTWNREVSRIIYSRCAACHREGGQSFSLMTYRDAQPRADAIKQAVLSRTMPPWGAVKGFGDFRDDQGLSQMEMELISDWVDGGLSRGNNPNALPETPKFEKPAKLKLPKNAITAAGEFTIPKTILLGGVLPKKMPEGGSPQITAVLPDGTVQPLIWLYEYRNGYQHPFWYRQALRLPAGTVVHGIP
jgi:hypothetical protein